MGNLQGKNALILGGSRGIGAAIVERLVQEKAQTSFTYNACASAANELAQRLGAKAIQADSADYQAVSNAIHQTGTLDILVVVAGQCVMGNPLEIDPAAIDQMIDVNIRSPYHASVEAAKSMHEGGRIIVVGSVNGDRMPMAGGAAYAMTKSAIQGMVRGLARDLGGKGITVNNIQPGPVDTDMNPESGPMRDTMHSFMAIKRHARPEEIAGMVAYLTGPEADMVTGAQLTIDGGFGA
ncbi:SDR family oxidoreductase [Endozoicomonas arenosclerae]|uniref:SDR family oxidoreductase n=1 Tax=Endozoicomonas arenosclerae TaxID=1633495 RepID=UPI000785FB88|nr:SDR family oxidoreductase [Endozoicomonas arenosclerae]